YAVRMHDRMPRGTRGGLHDEPRSEALFIAEPGGSIDTRMTVRPVQRGWRWLGPVAVVRECPAGPLRGLPLVLNQEPVRVRRRRAGGGPRPRGLVHPRGRAGRGAPRHRDRTSRPDRRAAPVPAGDAGTGDAAARGPVAGREARAAGARLRRLAVGGGGRAGP